jgi:hypothetical protein
MSRSRCHTLRLDQSKLQPTVAYINPTNQTGSGDARSKRPKRIMARTSSQVFQE